MNGSEQNDFKVMYAASIASAQGLNPYDKATLSRTLGEDIILPYVYPPSAAYAFSVFSFSSFRTASTIFLTLKILGLAIFTILLVKIFNFTKYLPVLLIFIPLAFNGAVLADLRAGNISLFEQVFIWTAFYFYIKGKPQYFASLIVITASFKLTPILLLGLLVFKSDRNERRTAIQASVVFVALLGANAVFFPNLFSAFLDNAAALNSPGIAGERGELNPATLQLIYDVALGIQQSVGLDIHRAFPLIVYAIVVCAILYFSAHAALHLRGNVTIQADLLRICLACFSYAIILPRFKNYSYILLIGPALYLIVTYATDKHSVFFACVICTVFLYRDFGIFGSLLAPIHRLQGEYYTLLVAWVLWSMCCRKAMWVKLNSSTPCPFLLKV